MLSAIKDIRLFVNNTSTSSRYNAGSIVSTIKTAQIGNGNKLITIVYLLQKILYNLIIIMMVITVMLLMGHLLIISFLFKPVGQHVIYEINPQKV